MLLATARSPAVFVFTQLLDGCAGGTTTSNAEAIACRALRAALDDVEPGSPIPDSETFREFLSALERVLPDALAQEQPYWQYESLDGILPEVARKTNPREAEILGLCVLISDQTLTPVHVRIAVSGNADEIAWLDCKLGEKGDGSGGLQRIPYDADRLSKELYLVGRYAPDIHWAYSTKVASRAAC